MLTTDNDANIPDMKTFASFSDAFKGRNWRNITTAEVAEALEIDSEEAEALLAWVKAYAEDLERFLG